MVGEHEIRKIGNKNFLIINCLHCANNSSLGNITCFRKILDKLRENPEVENLVFQRSYKKIMSDRSFRILKEYLDVIDSIEDESVRDKSLYCAT